MTGEDYVWLRAGCNCQSWAWFEVLVYFKFEVVCIPRLGCFDATFCYMNVSKGYFVRTLRQTFVWTKFMLQPVICKCFWDDQSFSIKICLLAPFWCGNLTINWLTANSFLLGNYWSSNVSVEFTSLPFIISSMRENLLIYLFRSCGYKECTLSFV